MHIRTFFIAAYNRFFDYTTVREDLILSLVSVKLRLPRYKKMVIARIIYTVDKEEFQTKLMLSILCFYHSLYKIKSIFYCMHIILISNVGFKADKVVIINPI